jgi:hypothetical protein
MVLVLVAEVIRGGRPKQYRLSPCQMQRWSSKDMIGKVEILVIVGLQGLQCDVPLPIPFGVVSAPQIKHKFKRKEEQLLDVETTVEQMDGVHHLGDLHRHHAPLHPDSI